MKRQIYDPQRAQRLVPLLRSITQEISERSRAIDSVEVQREKLSHGESSNRARAHRMAQHDAALAVHRRELRFATRELERLGCALDGDHPLRVLIPGQDGDLAHGWSWTPADENLEAVG